MSATFDMADGASYCKMIHPQKRPDKYTNYFVIVNLFFRLQEGKILQFFQISEAGTKDN